MAGINNTLQNYKPINGLLKPGYLGATAASTSPQAPTNQGGYNVGQGVSNFFTGANQRPGVTSPFTPSSNPSSPVISSLGGQNTQKSNIQTTQTNQNDQGGNQQNQQNQGLVTPPPTQNANTGIFPSVVGSLASTASQPNPQFNAAQEQYRNAASQLSQLKQASANNQFIGAGTNMAEYAGTQGLVANRLANQENALAGEMTAAQQAAQAATGQQQTQQQGLGQAGQLTYPLQAPYSNQILNPDTGQSIQPQGTQYGTGPAAAANVGSIQDQTQQVNNWSATRQSINNIVSNQLTPFLQQNGVNPSDFNAVNQFLQKIGAQTSSPQYQTLQNLVTDITSLAAGVLGTGGDTTDLKTRIGQSLLNPQASGKSILQVLGDLDNQMQLKIQGTQKNIQNIQSGKNPNTTNQSPSGSIYDF